MKRPSTFDETGRYMVHDARANQPWIQQSLFDRDVLEFTLTVGVVRSGDHAQIQYQVSDPIDGALVALESNHHVPSREVLVTLDRYLLQLAGDLDEFINPF